MLNIDVVLNEMNSLPPNRLEEVYAFVHSLHSMTKKNEKSRKKILSFAGSFSDMSVTDYADFKGKILETREQLFDRNIDI